MVAPACGSVPKRIIQPLAHSARRWACARGGWLLNTADDWLGLVAPARCWLAAVQVTMPLARLSCLTCSGCLSSQRCGHGARAGQHGVPGTAALARDGRIVFLIVTLGKGGGRRWRWNRRSTS